MLVVVNKRMTNIDVFVSFFSFFFLPLLTSCTYHMYADLLGVSTESISESLLLTYGENGANPCRSLLGVALLAIPDSVGMNRLPFTNTSVGYHTPQTKGWMAKFLQLSSTGQHDTLAEAWAVSSVREREALVKNVELFLLG